MTDYKDRVSGLATDIDWSKARPDQIWIEDLKPGLGNDVSGFYTEHKDRYEDDDGWFFDKAEKNEGIVVHRRPSPQWNGEGLPPVGTECEHKGNAPGNDDWTLVSILAHSKSMGQHVAVFQHGDHISYSSERYFRPIKTPAQIAAEDREAAIQAMIAACPYPGSNSTAIDCAALYDAGYRKGDDK